jgi:hypothetical protein
LRYKDDREDNFIFGKGVEDFRDIKMATAVYYFSPGFRLTLKNNIKLTAAININAVNYDFLDVVHNYDDFGERLHVLGIYSDFMVGISLFFNNSGRYSSNGIRKKQMQALPFYRQR